MPTVDEFRAALRTHLRNAELRGAREIEINAGALHRELGGYPTPSNAMPSCCNVMYDEMTARDDVISAPPKGRGASLTIRYYLPR